MNKNKGTIYDYWGRGAMMEGRMVGKPESMNVLGLFEEQKGSAGRRTNEQEQSVKGAEDREADGSEQQQLGRSW